MADCHWGRQVSANIDRFLEPVSAADPSGPDRTGEFERSAIDTVFDSGFSDDSGISDTNWKDVLSGIEGELATSKDLWLPIYMMRAGVNCGRLDVVETGGELLAALSDRFWDTVHPQLSEYGLQARITPCNSLADYGRFLLPLRRMVLISHARLGSYTADDFERFAQNAEAETGFGMFKAAMNDIGVGEPALLVEQLTNIRSALARTDATFALHSDGNGPNFQKTYEVLDQIIRAVSQYSGNSTDGPPDADKPKKTLGIEPSAQRAGGAIESRDDVLRAIDAIADYYRRKEPSSPLPVILKRARHWVNLDFLGILEDINPASIEEVKRVLVFQEKESDD